MGWKFWEKEEELVDLSEEELNRVKVFRLATEIEVMAKKLADKAAVLQKELKDKALEAEALAEAADKLKELHNGH